MTSRSKDADRLRRELRENYGIDLGYADDAMTLRPDPGDAMAPDDRIFLKAAAKVFSSTNPGYMAVIRRIRKEQSTDDK